MIVTSIPATLASNARHHRRQPHQTAKGHTNGFTLASMPKQTPASQGRSSRVPIQTPSATGNNAAVNCPASNV